jgi:hypothetical protein
VKRSEMYLMRLDRPVSNFYLVSRVGKRIFKFVNNKSNFIIYISKELIILKNIHT